MIRIIKETISHEVARSAMVLVLLLLVTLVGVFDHDLWAPDEPRAAEMSREFLDHGRWSVPTLNNEPFLEKPPLVYWTGALSLRVFGIHDWSVRIPCLLFGWGTLLFTYLLAKSLYGKEAAMGAVLVLATSAGFFLRIHEFESDVGLLFFTAAGAYFIYRAFSGSPWGYALASLSALGAFFSKGFLGFAFLGLLFVCWVIWTRNPKEILKARPWIWIPAISVPIAYWFVQLAADSRGNLLYTFVVSNHLHRFFSGANVYHGGHEQPFYYYFYTLPSQFFPWIIVLIAALPWLWSRRHDTGVRFLLCWFIPGFLLLSASLTKRGNYLVPLLPPLAVLVAAWFHARGKERWLAASTATVGVACVAASFFIAPWIVQEKSLKPFCQKLGSMTGPATKLYGFVPDETVSAAVPFYTGRYFVPVRQESELSALSKESGSEMVVFAFEKYPTDPAFETVQKYFPHVWIKDEREWRTMMLFSNVRKGLP